MNIGTSDFQTSEEAWKALSRVPRDELSRTRASMRTLVPAPGNFIAASEKAERQLSLYVTKPFTYVDNEDTCVSDAGTEGAAIQAASRNNSTVKKVIKQHNDALLSLQNIARTCHEPTLDATKSFAKEVAATTQSTVDEFGLEVFEADTHEYRSRVAPTLDRFCKTSRRYANEGSILIPGESPSVPLGGRRAGEHLSQLARDAQIALRDYDARSHGIYGESIQHQKDLVSALDSLNQSVVSMRNAGIQETDGSDDYDEDYGERVNSEFTQV